MLYYWQVGGFRSHVVPLEGKIPRSSTEIADTIFRYLAENDGVTLTLGIMPCGASYVLLPTSDEVPHGLRQLFLRARAHPPSRFLALSPVHFAAPAALAAKLDRLAQKGKKRKGAEPERDRSQANTRFTAGTAPDVVSRDGRARAGFEYHRLFYRLCRASIDSGEHDVVRVPWFDGIRAYAFAYNLHAASLHRPREERSRAPVVLDLGLAEWILPGSSMDLTNVGGNAHIVVQEHARLKNPGQGKYLYGESRELPRDAIAAHLREVFAPQPDAPMLLFVQNAAEAQDVLAFYGVHTAAWSTSFEPVVGKQIPPVGTPYPDARAKREPDPKRERDYYGRDYRGRDYDARDHYGRDGYGRAKPERSRSPRRGAVDTRRPRSRSRTPEPARSPYPVYVVDVVHLYHTMMSMPDDRVLVAAVAEKLGVRLEGAPDAPLPGSVGWCAGNECWLLAYIWRALAAGNAIDEQQVEVQNRPKPVAAPPLPTAEEYPDPHDLMMARAAAQAAAQGSAGQGGGGQGSTGRGYNPYDDWEDDEFDE